MKSLSEPDVISGFTYLIRSAPGLLLPSLEGTSMVGDARDMERGVLCLPLPSEARYDYLPVQAVPQGSVAIPDLIVDVADSGCLLTTLHFSTIWHRNGRHQWERVSFPNRRSAISYNRTRLELCQGCGLLHERFSLCDSYDSLKRALARYGSAMCYVDAHLYLVTLRPSKEDYHMVFKYAIWPPMGLVEEAKNQYHHLASAEKYLTREGISLQAGWQAVQARSPEIIL